MPVVTNVIRSQDWGLQTARKDYSRPTCMFGLQQQIKWRFGDNMSETLHHLILWAAAADALCSLFHTGRKYPIIDKFEY